MTMTPAQTHNLTCLEQDLAQLRTAYEALQSIRLSVFAAPARGLVYGEIARIEDALMFLRRTYATQVEESPS